MKPVVSLLGASKVYRLGHVETHAVSNADFSLQQGEFVVVVGASGSGKSTLLSLLGLLEPPSSGRVQVAGVDLTDIDDDQVAQLRGRYFGFVFQSYNLLHELTVEQNVRLPLDVQGLVAKPDRMAKVREALARVGMSERAMHYPDQLSGGQQQRVAVARAVVSDPAVLLADEPTGNLDRANSAAVMDLLLELNNKGTAIVLVTHDESYTRLARRVVRMSDGIIERDVELNLQN